MTEGYTKPAQNPDFQAPPSNKIQSEMQKKLGLLVYETFGTPSGQQLLDLLDDLYIRQACWSPGDPEGRAQWRSGQNNLILMFRAIYNIKKMGGEV